MIEDQNGKTIVNPVKCAALALCREINPTSINLLRDRFQDSLVVLAVDVDYHGDGRSTICQIEGWDRILLPISGINAARQSVQAYVQKLCDKHNLFENETCTVVYIVTTMIVHKMLTEWFAHEVATKQVKIVMRRECQRLMLRSELPYQATHNLMQLKAAIAQWEKPAKEALTPASSKQVPCQMVAVYRKKDYRQLQKLRWQFGDSLAVLTVNPGMFENTYQINGMDGIAAPAAEIYQAITQALDTIKSLGVFMVKLHGVVSWEYDALYIATKQEDADLLFRWFAGDIRQGRVLVITDPFYASWRLRPLTSEEKAMEQHDPHDAQSAPISQKHLPQAETAPNTDWEGGQSIERHPVLSELLHTLIQLEVSITKALTHLTKAEVSIVLKITQRELEGLIWNHAKLMTSISPAFCEYCQQHELDIRPLTSTMTEITKISETVRPLFPVFETNLLSETAFSNVVLLLNSYADVMGHCLGMLTGEDPIYLKP